jgi:predicted CoA-binding protein
MTTTGKIEEFLALRRVALVGVSRNPWDFSRRLFHDMCERGYDMVPVNPIAEEIEERECFPCLQAVKPPVDGALVMTAFHQTLRVVRGLRGGRDSASLVVPGCGERSGERGGG